MKKAIVLYGALVLSCSAGYAQALCANMNISSSGGEVPAKGEKNIYGPFNITCLDSVVLKFQDLSGHRPENIIEHVVERKVGGGWQGVFRTTSYGASSVDRSFFPSTTGEYRYKIINQSDAALANWRMDGRIPMFTIPGT